MTVAARKSRFYGTINLKSMMRIAFRKRAARDRLETPVRRGLTRLRNGACNISKYEVSGPIFARRLCPAGAEPVDQKRRDRRETAQREIAERRNHPGGLRAEPEGRRGTGAALGGGQRRSGKRRSLSGFFEDLEKAG